MGCVVPNIGADAAGAAPKPGAPAVVGAPSPGEGVAAPQSGAGVFAAGAVGCITGAGAGATGATAGTGATGATGAIVGATGVDETGTGAPVARSVGNPQMGASFCGIVVVGAGVGVTGIAPVITTPSVALLLPRRPRRPRVVVGTGSMLTAGVGVAIMGVGVAITGAGEGVGFCSA